MQAFKIAFVIVLMFGVLPFLCEYLIREEPGLAFFVLWFSLACISGFIFTQQRENPHQGHLEADL